MLLRILAVAAFLAGSTPAVAQLTSEQGGTNCSGPVTKSQLSTFAARSNRAGDTECVITDALNSQDCDPTANTGSAIAKCVITSGTNNTWQAIGSEVTAGVSSVTGGTDITCTPTSGDVTCNADGTLARDTEVPSLEQDPVFGAMDTETELETQLTDVTDVFTNNDGALTDDDLTDDSVGELQDVTLSGTPQNRDVLVYDGVSAFVDRLLVEADISDLSHTTDTGPAVDCATATHVQLGDGSCVDPATQAELDTHEGQNANVAHGEVDPAACTNAACTVSLANDTVTGGTQNRCARFDGSGNLVSAGGDCSSGDTDTTCLDGSVNCLFAGASSEGGAATSAAALENDALDSMVEIATTLKVRADDTDTKLLTTSISPPSSDTCLEMDSNGSVVLASAACGTGSGGAPGTDTVGTDELDDGANSPTAGYAVIVDSGTTAFEYVDPATQAELDTHTGNTDIHIDHTAVSVTAGDGLTGGGDISATRNFAVGAGTGIAVNANDVQFSYADAGASPALGADECVFSNEGTSDGGWVCEGPVADSTETRFRVTESTTTDKIITFPDATGEVTLLGQSIDDGELTETYCQQDKTNCATWTLGTDTSGDYVASVADAGNGTVTVTGTGAGAAVTLDVVDLNCTDCIGGTEIAQLTLGTDTTAELDPDACTNTNCTLDLTGDVIGGGTASRCARFDGSGNLVAAGGDCSSGDTTLSGATAGGDLSGTYPNPSVQDDSHNHGDSTVDNNLTIAGGTIGTSAITLNSGTSPTADGLIEWDTTAERIKVGDDGAATLEFYSGRHFNNSDETDPVFSAETSLSALETRIGTTLVPTSQKGAANGVAELDGSAKVPVSQLPDSVVGSVKFAGTWNANTNSPNLTTTGCQSSPGDEGNYYVVATAGSTNLDGETQWEVGDWAICEDDGGLAWARVGAGSRVTSVHGRVGAVVSNTSDYDAVQIDNTAAGNIASTNVQSALNELDSEKLAIGAAAGGDLAGTYPNPTIGADSVALSTDTTGNYVATIADAGNGKVTVANSGVEGAAVTLDIATLTLGTDTTAELDPDACTNANCTVDLTGDTVTGGTASRCARFDGSGNLVAAGGDCSSGDTTIANTTCDTDTCTLDDDTIVLLDANGAAPTTDGEIKYDRTSERIEVGDGSGTVEFYSGAHTVDTDTTCLDAGVTCNFAGSSSEGGAATSAAGLEADALDAMTEIATSLKVRADDTDTKLLTTSVSAPGSATCLEMDTNGSVVLSSGACGVAGSVGTDVVGTDELDDGANTPTAGYAVIVDSGATAFEYVDPATQAELNTHTGQNANVAHGEIDPDACTNANCTVDLSGDTVTGGTASRCARFDGSGNLVAASGDCSAGDTDTTLSGSAAGGDLSGTYPNPSVNDDSHNHGDSTVDNNLTIAGGTIGTSAITLNAGTAPTTDGLIEWDTTDERIKVGDDGAATLEFYPGAHTVDTTLAGTSAGGDLTGTYPNPTIAGDAVALGTDTTGNYVATVAPGAGSKVTVTGSGSEGAAVTLGLSTLTIGTDTTAELDPDACSNANCTVDITGDTVTGGTASRCARFDGSGNLVAAGGDCSSGDTTIANTTCDTDTCTLDDDTIVLLDANGAAPTTDGEIKYDRTTERIEVGDGASTVEFYSGAHNPDQNLFATVDVPTGTDPSAGSTTDTLTLADGSGIEITGSATNTVTIAATLGTSIDDTEVDNNLTIAAGTISNSDITLKQGTAPTPTVEGRIEWDTDDDRLIVGDGTGTVEFYSGRHFNNSDETDPVFSAETTLSALETRIGTTLVPTSQKGVASGVATLDGSAKVPVSQLPDSVVGSVKFAGTWNANTNSPDLTSTGCQSSPGDEGNYYVVATAGSTNLDGETQWEVGDWAICEDDSGLAWARVGAGSRVTSVHGRVGAVVSNTSDYDAVQIDNTPAGNIAATNVQAALNELDSDKLAIGATAGGDLQGTYPDPTIKADAVALGTDTTGNYVATVAPGAGSKVTVTGSGSEGAAVTLGLSTLTIGTDTTAELDPDACTNTNCTVDISGDVITTGTGGAQAKCARFDASGNLVAASGDCSSGDTTIANTTCDTDTCTLNDDTIVLLDANGAAPTTDGEIKYDRTTERIEVGDGSGTVEFYSGAHTTDTNAGTICSGTTTYLDGEGACDDISGVYVDVAGDTMTGTLNGTTFAASSDVTVGGISVDVDGHTHVEADVTDLDHTATAITDGLIVEADLNEDSGTPTDEDVLTYDSTGGNFLWVAQNTLDAGTAIDLAANGANCAAGEIPLGVDTKGAVEGCYEPAFTDVTGSVTDAQVPDNITIDLAATATALASDPTDCSANQYAHTIAANGNLTCSAISDADVPNSITIDLAATATALAANGGNCAAGEIPLGVDASGAVEGCYEPAFSDVTGAVTDAQVPNDITIDEATLASTVTVADIGGDTTSFVALTTDATGSLSVDTDAGITYNATSNVLTATGFAGNLTGTADFADRLSLDPSDCAAGEFANAIDREGDLTCATVGLNTLSDVTITGPLQNRDALMYDSTATEWVDRPLVEADISDLAHFTNSDETDPVFSAETTLSALETRIGTTLVPTSQKGAANGVASLDGSAKVPVSQLPDSVVGSVKFAGTWNANTNSPDLTSTGCQSSPGDEGNYYVVATAGSTNLDGETQWEVGDWAICEDDSGLAWARVGAGSRVTSVHGRVGAVTANTSDYDAVQVDNTAAGNIAATNVQAALNELDSEKLAIGATAGGDLQGTYPDPTIKADAVALGTDTTGNYVATIADAGSGKVTVANSGTETAAVTLDIADVFVLNTGDTIDGSTSTNLTITGGSAQSGNILTVENDSNTSILAVTTSAGNASVQLPNDAIGDAEVANALTIAGGTIGTSDITLKGGTSPTADGRIEWDSTAETIKVGDDNTGTLEFHPGAHFTSANETDPVFSAVDTEAELESHLTDVTNVFTNNDGALDDDDLTDDTIGTLSDVSVTGPLASGDVLIHDGSNFVDRPLTAGDIASGTLAHERGGLEADVSAYNGLVRISSGTTTNITDLSGLNTALGSSIADGAHNADQNLFETFATPSGTNPVADSTTDTLTFAAGTGITISGDSATDTITLTPTLGDSISAAEIADGTHGDFTYTSGVASLNDDVVAQAEMADADHGDVAWSGGTAEVQSMTTSAIGADTSVSIAMFGDPSGTVQTIHTDPGLVYDATNNVLTATDHVTIGDTEYQMTVNGTATTSRLAIATDTGETTVAEVEAHRHENSAPTRGAIFYGGRSRGSIATPAAVQSGDRLLTIYALGHDGTDEAISAEIDFTVGNTPGNNDMPGTIELKTSADGSQSPTTRLTIDEAGVSTFSGNVVISATGDDSLQLATGAISDAEVANDLTIAGGTIGTSAITLVQSTTPTPTAEGRVEWDTDGDLLVIGDGGTGQAIFHPGAHTTVHGNGANCAAGEIALGVDENGAVEGCYEPDFTDVTGSVTDAQVPNNITIDLATEATTVSTATTTDATASLALFDSAGGSAQGLKTDDDSGLLYNASTNVLTVDGDISITGSGSDGHTFSITDTGRTATGSIDFADIDVTLSPSGSQSGNTTTGMNVDMTLDGAQNHGDVRAFRSLVIANNGALGSVPRSTFFSTQVNGGSHSFVDGMLARTDFDSSGIGGGARGGRTVFSWNGTGDPSAGAGTFSAAFEARLEIGNQGAATRSTSELASMHASFLNFTGGSGTTITRLDGIAIEGDWSSSATITTAAQLHLEDPDSGPTNTYAILQEDASGNATNVFESETTIEGDRIIGVETKCANITDLQTTDDNIMLFTTNRDITVTDAYCVCRGTCSTTTTIKFENKPNGNGFAGNIFGTNNNITCSVWNNSSTSTSGYTGSSVSAFNQIQIDTETTTGGDEHLICFEYTVN